MVREPNSLERIVNFCIQTIDVPVTFIRETIDSIPKTKYPWYHQQFRRVPTIDECYEDDIACYEEANMQFLRDKMVDAEIVKIMNERYEHCAWENFEDKELFCSDLLKAYKDAQTAWFIKYGDMGIKCNVVSAFMKQKHRMVWERRHGPVGSGRKTKYTTVEEQL